MHLAKVTTFFSFFHRSTKANGIMMLPMTKDGKLKSPLQLSPLQLDDDLLDLDFAADESTCAKSYPLVDCRPLLLSCLKCSMLADCAKDASKTTAAAVRKPQYLYVFRIKFY